MKTEKKNTRNNQRGKKIISKNIKQNSQILRFNWTNLSENQEGVNEKQMTETPKKKAKENKIRAFR